MATQYLTDSNAVIEFLGAALPASGSQWMQQIIQQRDHHHYCSDCAGSQFDADYAQYK